MVGLSTTGKRVGHNGQQNNFFTKNAKKNIGKEKKYFQIMFVIMEPVKQRYKQVAGKGRRCKEGI